MTDLKLKTLKDLRMKKDPDYSYSNEWIETFMDKLRQEAIRHIKHFQNQKGECRHGDATYMPACQECQGKLTAKIDYIKWDKNISEEDISK